MKPSELPPNRYTIVEIDDSSGIEPGSMVESLQLKSDLKAGIYPSGTMIEDVETGALYRVQVIVEAVTFASLTAKQADRAVRYRKAWLPRSLRTKPSRETIGSRRKP